MSFHIVKLAVTLSKVLNIAKHTAVIDSFIQSVAKEQKVLPYDEVISCCYVT